MGLGFPWQKPSSRAKATKSNGFTDRITDTGFRNGELFIDVFEQFISAPLKSAYMFCRMHGYCGLLIGYADGGNLSSVAGETSEIVYLQVIPKPWIDEIIYKQVGGNPTLPLTVEKYKVNISSTPQVIDGSRMVLVRNPSLDAKEIGGEPSLKCVYDLITVLKSMDWGVGQAMWRHGGGLTAFIVADTRNQQEQIDAIDDLVTDINAMTTLTLPAGTQMYSERSNSLDPEPYYRVINQQLAMGTRIPTSILIGSQAGALSASMKDRHDYYELLTDIQGDVLNPVLMDILMRFQASGQIGAGDITIEWEDMPVWADGTSHNDDNGDNGGI